MLLSEEEFENPAVFSSLLKCMRPLIDIKNTDKLVHGGEDEDETEDFTAEEALQVCQDGVCPRPRH